MLVSWYDLVSTVKICDWVSRSSIFVGMMDWTNMANFTQSLGVLYACIMEWFTFYDLLRLLPDLGPVPRWSIEFGFFGFVWRFRCAIWVLCWLSMLCVLFFGKTLHWFARYWFESLKSGHQSQSIYKEIEQLKFVLVGIIRDNMWS
jgi:hypothetical protein